MEYNCNTCPQVFNRFSGASATSCSCAANDSDANGNGCRCCRGVIPVYIGPPGPQGAAGETATNDNLMASSPAATVPAGMALPFQTVNTSNGSSIAIAGGSESVMLNTGVYRISFKANAFATSVATVQVGVVMRQNGVNYQLSEALGAASSSLPHCLSTEAIIDVSGTAAISFINSTVNETAYNNMTLSIIKLG